jgi:hypothetical protein
MRDPHTARMEDHTLARNGELIVAVIAIVIAVAGGIAHLAEPVEPRAQTAQR